MQTKDLIHDYGGPHSEHENVNQEKYEKPTQGHTFEHTDVPTSIEKLEGLKRATHGEECTPAGRGLSVTLLLKWRNRIIRGRPFWSRLSLHMITYERSSLNEQ